MFNDLIYPKSEMSKLSKKSNESTFVALNLFHLVAKYCLDVLDVRWYAMNYAMICDTVCVCHGVEKVPTCSKSASNAAYCCEFLLLLLDWGCKTPFPMLWMRYLNAYLNLIQRFIYFNIFHIFQYISSFWIRCRFMIIFALKNRFLCRSWGVMRRWILGALLFLPSFTSRRTTNWRTSSCHQAHREGGGHRRSSPSHWCRVVMCHQCHRIRFCVVWNALKRLKASKKSGLNRLDSFNWFSWENALRINENIQTWDW